MKVPYTGTRNEFVGSIYRTNVKSWAIDFTEIRAKFDVSCHTQSYPKWKLNMFLKPGEMQDQFVLTLTRVRNGNTRINYDSRGTAGHHMFQIWQAYGELLEILEGTNAHVLR